MKEKKSNMVITSQIASLKALVDQDCNSIPSFINPANTTHFSIYEYIQEIFITISKLITEKLLSEKIVQNYFFFISHNMDCLASLSKDIKLLYNIKNYINESIEIYLGIALSYDITEGYYVASNLQKFKKLIDTSL